LGRGVAIVAVTSDPSTDWVAALRQLQRRGIRTLAVLIAADTFGTVPSPQRALAELEASGIPSYLVQRGADLAAVLSQYGPGPRPMWAYRPTVAVR